MNISGSHPFPAFAIEERFSSLVKPAKLMVAAVFFYLLSGQAMGIRNPLAEEMGWWVYLQLLLLFLAFGVSAYLWAKLRAEIKPPISTRLFLLCTGLAMVCSVRSFWPPLSIVKACTLLVVMTFSVLLCSCFSAKQVLEAVYKASVGVFGLGLLLGLLAPGQYPLWTTDDYNGRQRLNLFAWVNGDFSFISALAFLIGSMPFVRGKWYFQVFLFVLTVASGSRTAAVSLLVVWLLFRVTQVKSLGGKVALCCLIPVIAIGYAWYAIEASGGKSLLDAATGFYGSGAVEDASTLDGRTELWKGLLGIFPSCVLLGYGLDGTRDYLLKVMPWAGNPHHGLIDLYLATGGLGLAVFLIAWFMIVRKNWTAAQSRPLLAISGFLAIIMNIGPAFTVFQFLGLFLLVCLDYASSETDAKAARPLASAGVLSQK
jgi:hypothetical protein